MMSETLLFRKDLSQLGWQPLHYMLKKQNLILHGTKCKSKDIEGMIEESRKEIIPTHQTHGVTKLCEPEAKFYDWRAVLEKLCEVGAVSESYVEKVSQEYAEKKPENEQERERVFLGESMESPSEKYIEEEDVEEKEVVDSDELCES